MEYTFKTENTCAKTIKFTLKGDIVTNVEFLGGGCPGNLQALPKLIEGMTVKEVEEKIGGIKCGRKQTSCADQLAKAVSKAFEKSKTDLVMKYKIREIEAKDNKEIENVIRTCLIEFGANHEGTAWTDPNLSRFSEIYNTEGNKYWVAIDENDKIVGGVGIGKLEGIDDVCELQKMYCLPEVRGTGVSHKLIDIALEYGKNYYSRCYLETLENMVAAQKFYEKYGFTRIHEPLVKTEHFACDVRYIKELR